MQKNNKNIKKTKRKTVRSFSTKKNCKKYLKNAKKGILWTLRHKFLSYCILFFVMFSFIGSCSKIDFSNNYTSAEIKYLSSLRAKYSGNGRVLSVAQTKDVIDQACQFLAINAPQSSTWNTEDARDLLLGTAIIESDLKARYQDSAGNAIGLFQVEYLTFKDLWNRALPVRHPQIYQAMRTRFGNIEFEHLQTNDVICAIFARVKYFDSPYKLPSMKDLDAQAAYYKKVYNTAGGKGDVQTYKKKKLEFLNKQM